MFVFICYTNKSPLSTLEVWPLGLRSAISPGHLCQVLKGHPCVSSMCLVVRWGCSNGVGVGKALAQFSCACSYGLRVGRALSRTHPFILCCGDSVYPAFRVFSGKIIPYVVAKFLVSGGGGEFRILLGHHLEPLQVLCYWNHTHSNPSAFCKQFFWNMMLFELFI